jgi:hypothetical protein
MNCDTAPVNKNTSDDTRRKEHKVFLKGIVINTVVIMGYKFINNMYKFFLLR